MKNAKNRRNFTLFAVCPPMFSLAPTFRLTGNFRNALFKSAFHIPENALTAQIYCEHHTSKSRQNGQFV